MVALIVGKGNREETRLSLTLVDRWCLSTSTVLLDNKTDTGSTGGQVNSGIEGGWGSVRMPVTAMDFAASREV